MKVFNKSVVRFAHHDIVIGPGITQIPPARELSVRELVKKYPDKLSEVTNDARSKGSVAADDAMRRENAQLKAQVAKLQKLLTEDPANMEPKAVANRRANKAEADLGEANATIERLTAELNALKTSGKV